MAEVRQLRQTSTFCRVYFKFSVGRSCKVADQWGQETCDTETNSLCDKKVFSLLEQSVLFAGILSIKDHCLFINPAAPLSRKCPSIPTLSVFSQDYQFVVDMMVIIFGEVMKTLLWFPGQLFVCQARRSSGRMCILYWQHHDSYFGRANLNRLGRNLTFEAVPLFCYSERKSLSNCRHKCGRCFKRWLSAVSDSNFGR